MKSHIHHRLYLLVFSLFLGARAALADPLITSWFTANSGKYARVYTSTANRTAGIASTTWSTQTSPTYAGIHEIDYSANWVYLRNSGLGSYVMGPWNNPNYAKNQGTSTSAYRFPRGNAGVTNTAATKTLTGLGAIGRLVDGVSIYNDSDGFSYSYSHSQDASPTAGIGNGDGVWNRDALPNEGNSFDYALNHPQPSGDYHSHANPIAIRYLLGDNVNYDNTTKNYSENTNTTVFKHSPLLGWMNDGIPLYGPYGYSNATNAASKVRRMVSGYVLRNGQYGTTNLGVTGRKTLPAWAALAQGISATLSATQYGPNTNATYALGHFMEDYDYLGDLGYVPGVTNADGTLYDLNKYNARWCVTPEFPNGTWAYFESIQANGTSWYPYHTGRWYLDSPTGGATTTTVMNSDTPLTLYFKGGTNMPAVLNAPTVSAGNVTLVWSAVEGGTYQVNVTTNLAAAWSTNTALTLTATNNTASASESGAATTYAKRFYRVNRTGVATFDSAGY